MKPDEELSLSSCDQLTGKRGQMDFRNQLGNPKRRVGRPRKHPVAEVRSSDAKGFPTKVPKPPAAQYQSSRDNLPRTNRANLKRRAGRPRKHSAPEAKLSNVGKVPERLATHSLLSHTGLLWKNVQRKRKVGRPRKHPVSEIRSQANSKETGRPEMHDQLLSADAPRTEIHENVSNTAADRRSRTKYGQASRVTAQKEFPACQATMNSSGLPKQAGNISSFPFKVNVMAVIYPCQEISAHLPSEVLVSTVKQEEAHTEAREPSFHRVSNEDHCDGNPSSSVDGPINQEIDDAPIFPAVPQCDSQKRRRGRPKKRRNRPRSDITNLSNSVLVSEISSACNIRQIVPQQNVEKTHQHVSKEVAKVTFLELRQCKMDFASLGGTQSVHENGHNVPSPPVVPDARKRGPGRPAMRRIPEDVTTLCNIASAAKPPTIDVNVSSHCFFPSVNGHDHILPSSTPAAGSDAPKSESERPKKRLRNGDVMTLGGLTSPAKSPLVGGNEDQVVPEKPQDHGASNQQESREIRENSKIVRAPYHSSDVSTHLVNMPAFDRIGDIYKAFSPVVRLEIMPCRQIEMARAKRTTPVKTNVEKPASMESDLARDDGVLRRKGPIDVERQKLRQPAEIPHHPSLTVRAGSGLQQKETAAQRGSEVAAAGDEPPKSGAEAYLGGRVPQVKLLPLAVALGRELASQNSPAVLGPSTGQRATEKLGEMAPPESSVREVERNQVRNANT